MNEQSGRKRKKRKNANSYNVLHFYTQVHYAQSTESNLNSHKLPVRKNAPK